MADQRTNGVSAVQQEARALADPTRYRIFRHVVEALEPPRVASISQSFGLSESAVRQHLSKLCEAGLVVEERAARKGPGRPPLQYRLSAQKAGGWRIPSPYQELTMLCLQLLSAGGSAREVGVAAGQRATVGATVGRGTLDHLEAEMARRGFEPQRVGRGQSIDLVLGHCPYEAAALADREVVCNLHRGLAEGIATAAGGEVEVIGLIARDPRQAGCRLQTRRSEEVPSAPRDESLTA
jgi:predicted ArsR family transcriptional regulator